MLVIKRILKRKVLILALLAIIFSANAQNAAYISNHKTVANLLSEHYGIPASVILAVAYVESAAGKCATAKVLNNHFGIEGRNSYVNSKGHKSRYKQYNTEIASYVDFCKMISRKKFYNRLKDNDDPKVWIKAMSHAGYSEQPQVWEQKILSTIRSNRL
jgi:flagellum-specific peptidoglycan hydrolase FlgJ